MARNLSHWTPQTTGTSTVTVDAAGRKAAIIGNVGEVAFLQRSIKIDKGDVVKVSVISKLTTGTPKIIMDYPIASTNVQAVLMNKSGLAEYTTTWIVPKTAVSADIVQLNIGVFTADDGVCDIYDPIVTINGIDIDSASYIEAGSGSNGTYVKYGDGRMICQKNIVVGVCNTAWGNVFAGTLTSVGSFEKTFVGTPIMSYGTPGDGSASAWVYSAGSGIAATVSVVRGTASTGTFSVDVTATGRWVA